ncbi:DUF6270 domain-containing protein [Brachybacterium kimchii]|uniref:DUF6270 domain-containing protein n=1 Tax=Brachybacterium kimchii TaxID=2942909 RepID=A0ABY4N1U0_9MICO|nr:DUF6270 domain-containing protein [Brachybacterium kimchii]UQN28081.1 DUF6270 domain-containing protein [Brachybacterium kimchii]
MSEPSGNGPLRVAIYGSCVARDTVDLAAPEGVEVVDYVARQSLLSIGKDASSRFPEHDDVDSPFQRRQMLGDFAGDAARRVMDAAPSTDVLLWDLTDERHGVQAYLDGTVVTRSIDVMRSPAVKAALRGSLHVPFGDEDHFAAWTGAAESFHGELARAGLVEKTVVLAVPWAQTSLDGESTPWSMGISAPDANERFSRYYDHLRSLGLRVLALEDEAVHSDPAHRWGHAPFHYAQDVYERIAAEVLGG